MRRRDALTVLALAVPALAVLGCNREPTLLNNGSNRFVVSKSAPINELEVSRDGKFAITGDSDGVVVVTSLADGSQAATWNTLRYVASIAVNSECVVTSGAQSIEVRSYGDWKVLGQFRPRDRFGKVALSAFPGHVIVSGGHDSGFIRTWAVGNPCQLVGSCESFTDAPSATAYCPRSDRIAIGSEDGRAEISTVGRRTPSIVLPVANDRISAMAFSRDGCKLALSIDGRAGAVQVYDSASGARDAEFALGTTVHAVRFSPSGRTLMACGGMGDCLRGVVQVWEIESQATVFRSETNDLATACDYSNEGTIVVGVADGAIELWTIPASP